MKATSALIAALILLLTAGGTASAQDGWVNRYSPGILLQGPPGLQRDARAALDRLKALPTGRLLLASLDASGHLTAITLTEEENGFARPANAKDARTPGVGTETTIRWNPGWRGERGREPSALVLGHELIHALHIARGELDTGWAPELCTADHPRGLDLLDYGTKVEELRTVGIAPFAGRISTNNLRRDWNRRFGTRLRLRTSYRHWAEKPDPAAEPKRRARRGLLPHLPEARPPVIPEPEPN